MNLTIKQISSMHKIRSIDDIPANTFDNIYNTKMLLKGQHFSYQIVLSSNDNLTFKAEVDSPLKEYVNLYAVKSVIMDHPVSTNTKNTPESDDFITKEPGFMPDMLLPLKEQNDFLSICENPVTLWVEVCVPKDIDAGKYDINIVFDGGTSSKKETAVFVQKMQIEILDAQIPEQKTVFTQWFHVDCIANYHNAELYSEEHWHLIDNYMNLASKLGINMILTPVLTPSLDIAEGMYRAKTQLTDIEKSGDKYIFDFSKLKRWIGLLKKNNIKYVEVAHLFSQWGLKYSPNIVVSENGKTDYMFGWNVPARDVRYKEFLEQFLPALTDCLKEERVFENTRFHISDEPTKENLEEYKYAYNIVRPLIGDCKIIDAISDYEFYKEGLMDIPVSINSSVHDFIDNNAEELYTYNCCGPDTKESNRFMCMASYRNRIIGIQMYKYDIKGFLHWGYNFYNNQLSRYPIDPYVTTSADCGFPSGDSFSVYPYKDGAVPSLRAIVFRDALEDMEVCRLLESYIGKEKVVQIIENQANMTITFADYPRNSLFIPNVMEEVIKKIKENL